MIERKFNIGDIVREQTASKRSHTMTVISYRDPGVDIKFTNAIMGKEVKNIEATTLYVNCEFFLYGKTQRKSFDQDNLVLVNPSTSGENK